MLICKNPWFNFHQMMLRSTGSRSFFLKSFSAACGEFSETIYAISSGRGKCGVSVIRVTGPQSSNILQQMVSRSRLPTPRFASLEKIVDPKKREPLDKALVLWFPGPKSFTGEDSCEFHVHGGIAVTHAVLSALNKFNNTRPALAGEFTKRAFINGKLDLTEVEGLGDLIHAETESQRHQAIRQMSGELSSLYNTWRRQLIKCRAALEAWIDFSEEENIEDGVLDDVKKSLEELKSSLAKHLKDGRKGERLRDGVNVAILGAPNVGKSTLLNYLCRRDAAIVTDIPGTTRDLLEISMDLSGLPVVLVDTAGIRRAPADVVETEGIHRAINRSGTADLILLVLDSSQLNVKSAEVFSESIKSELIKFSQQISDQTDHPDDDSLEPDRYFILINKTDKLKTSMDLPSSISMRGITIPLTYTSFVEHSGLEQMTTGLTASVRKLCADPTSPVPSLTAARHRDHAESCLNAVHDALSILSDDPVIAAEYLRQACDEMGQLTGVISAEQILDVIFKDFCIGK